MRFLVLLAIALAAIASDVPCSAVLEDAAGKFWSYNFSALNHPDGVGSDIEYGPTQFNTMYFVNVCGESLLCTGNAVCFKDRNLAYHGLGATRTQEISWMDRSGDPSLGVKLLYTEGEQCWPGGPNHLTVVYVACSAAADEPFVSEARSTSNCSSVINIWSKHGCGVEVSPPTPVESSSSEAKVPCTASFVDENGAQWDYDLSALNHPDGQGDDMKFGAAGSTYFLNLCGHTKSCSGNAVCREDTPVAYHGLGSTATQRILTANAGGVNISSGVKVTYSGGDVCGDSSYTSVVNVQCDASAGTGAITGVTTAGCLTTITVRSAHGCGKRVETPSEDEDWCLFSYNRKGKSYNYNFTSLSRTPEKSSDLMFGPDQRGNTFYLNMCGETVLCPGNAVCLKDRYMRLTGFGRTSTQLFAQSNVTGETNAIAVMATYTEGDVCEDDAGVQHKRSTIVYIGCNQDAVVPFISSATEGNCSYTLMVWSVQGCAKTKSTNDMLQYILIGVAGVAVLAIVAVIIVIGVKFCRSSSGRSSYTKIGEGPVNDA